MSISGHQGVYIYKTNQKYFNCEPYFALTCYYLNFIARHTKSAG